MATKKKQFSQEYWNNYFGSPVESTGPAASTTPTTQGPQPTKQPGLLSRAGGYLKSQAKYAIQHPKEAAKTVGRTLIPESVRDPYYFKKQREQIVAQPTLGGKVKQVAKGMAQSELDRIETALNVIPIGAGARVAGKGVVAAVKAGAKMGAKAGLGFGPVNIARKALKGEKQTAASMALDIALPPVLGAVGGAVLGPVGTLFGKKGPKIIGTPEERVAVMDYIASKGTKLREKTPTQPDFMKVPGGILDVKKGEVIPVNNYKDNIPTLKGIKVKEYGDKVVGFNSDGTAITVDNTFNKERVKRAFKYLRDEQGQYAGRESLGVGGEQYRMPQKGIKVYHGTDQTTLDKYGYKFKPNTFFTDTPENAQRYANIAGDKPVVVSGYLDIKNPVEIKTDFVSYHPSQNEINNAIKNGNDGFKITTRDGHVNILPLDATKQFTPSLKTGEVGVGGEQFRTKLDENQWQRHIKEITGADQTPKELATYLDTPESNVKDFTQDMIKYGKMSTMSDTEFNKFFDSMKSKSNTGYQAFKQEFERNLGIMQGSARYSTLEEMLNANKNPLLSSMEDLNKAATRQEKALAIDKVMSAQHMTGPFMSYSYGFGDVDRGGQLITQSLDWLRNQTDYDVFRLKDDFQKLTGLTMSDAQEQQIIARGKKYFGENVDIKIVGQIFTPKGQEALGSYREGMIKIVAGQGNPLGSLDHEAVHGYLDIFTTASEQADLLLQAKKQFGTADLATTEEQLAERFINYAAGKEKASPFKTLFDKVITRIKSYFGNEDEIKTFYSDILGGKAAKPKGALPVTPRGALAVEPTKAELTTLEPTYMTPEKMMRQDDIKIAKTRMSEIVKEEAQAMRQVEEQATVGLQPTAEGGYKRVSEHSPEYRQFYADKGKKPNNAFYKDLAQKNLEAGKGQFQQEYSIVRDVVNAPEIGALPPTPAEAIPTKVPGTMLPVGEGAVKTSKLAQRITSRLENLDQQTKDALPTYNVMNKQDQIAAAVKYVESNPDEAMAVLRGDVAPPQGLLRNSVGLALEEKAIQDGDAELARNLASLYSTRAGQEISILTERDSNSPIRYIADLQKAKIEARGGQEAVSRATKEEIPKIQSEMIKTRPTKQSWSEFIDSLKCGA